jgi:hypothetical protein
MSADLPDGFNLDVYGTIFGNNDDDRFEIYPRKSQYDSWISPWDQQVRVTVNMAHEEPMHQQNIISGDYELISGDYAKLGNLSNE